MLLFLIIVDRYNVEGFLDKNKDTLYQDFKRLLYNWYVRVQLFLIVLSGLRLVDIDSWVKFVSFSFIPA